MPKRYQLEEWVAWEASRQELWVKIGTIAAIVATVAAIAAAILAFLAWRFPAVTPNR